MMMVSQAPPLPPPPPSKTNPKVLSSESLLSSDGSGATVTVRVRRWVSRLGNSQVTMTIERSRDHFPRSAGTTLYNTSIGSFNYTTKLTRPEPRCRFHKKTET